MFAIIKNKEIIWFSDYEITQENMSFDSIIEWDFDTNKNYLFKNWEVIKKRIYTQQEMQAIQRGAFISETGDVEITPEIELKIELAGIEERLKGSKERYTELKEMGEMRSNSEEVEFQTLETGKNTLLARRKQILDSFD